MSPQAPGYNRGTLQGIIIRDGAKHDLCILKSESDRSDPQVAKRYNISHYVQMRADKFEWINRVYSSQLADCVIRVGFETERERQRERVS